LSNLAAGSPNVNDTPLAKPDWASFFALEINVPDDFLTERNDRPPPSHSVEHA
jgi:hypothetical protein